MSSAPGTGLDGATYPASCTAGGWGPGLHPAFGIGTNLNRVLSNCASEISGEDYGMARRWP